MDAVDGVVAVGVVVGLHAVVDVAQGDVAAEGFASGEVEADAGREVERAAGGVIGYVVESDAAAEVEKAERRRSAEARAQKGIDRERAVAVVDHHVDCRSYAECVDDASAIAEVGVEVERRHVVGREIYSSAEVGPPDEM